jgi:hypothetical protein
MLAENETGGDLLVAHALRHQAQDLEFAMDHPHGFRPARLRKRPPAMA